LPEHSDNSQEKWCFRDITILTKAYVIDIPSLVIAAFVGVLLPFALINFLFDWIERRRKSDVANRK
jgi:uncharacterized protein YqhQ